MISRFLFLECVIAAPTARPVGSNFFDSSIGTTSNPALKEKKSINATNAILLISIRSRSGSKHYNQTLNTNLIVNYDPQNKHETNFAPLTMFHLEEIRHNGFP